MSASIVRPEGHELDPHRPLRLQATSLEAEIEAVQVFRAAARRDREAGDLRAPARITALDKHEQQLRVALLQIEIGKQSR